MIRLACALALASVAFTQDLRLHFRLDEVAGTTLVDSSGNGHDGTLAGSPGLGLPGPDPGTVTCIDFDGVDDAGAVPNANDLKTLNQDFSIAFWVFPHDLAAYEPVFGNPASWTVVVFADTLRLQTSFDKLFVSHGFQNGWNHVAVTFDPALLATFYVNGVPVGTKQATGLPNTPVNDWLLATSPINNFPSDFLDGRIDDVQVYSGTLTAADVQFLFQNPGATLAGGGNPIGTNYCGPANLNSSGQPGVIAAFGSVVAAHDSVRIDATQLPTNEFGYFLNSMTKGFAVPPGSQGNLCLGGSIGRYVANAASTGASGELSLQLDLTQTPTPFGDVAILAGERWFFQCWFRDMNPGSTSNFTDAIEIGFQ